jgi:hypothetical protein
VLEPADLAGAVEALARGGPAPISGGAPAPAAVDGRPTTSMTGAIRKRSAFTANSRRRMKKVVSGGPRHAIAFRQANAGLPDTIPLN